MQVSKWGNSLAIRLPSSLVEALNLKAGDHVEVRLAGERDFVVERDPERKKAIQALRTLRLPLPAGFRFDREEANER